MKPAYDLSDLEDQLEAMATAEILPTVREFSQLWTKLVGFSSHRALKSFQKLMDRQEAAPIGYQIGDSNGHRIQHAKTTHGLRSYDVMERADLVAFITKFGGDEMGWHPIPVYVNDLEEPNFVDDQLRSRAY